MGLLTLGLGVGGAGAYGSAFHLVTNGVAKGLLFLTAGNIFLPRAESTGERHGVLRALPVTGTLLVAGLFAVTGSPPFGTFLSMFTIVRGAFTGGHPVIGGATLLFLAIAFAGIARVVLALAWSAPMAVAAGSRRESAWLIGAPVVLMLALIALGLHVPAALQDRLTEAAAALGGRAP
jgi:hydrogenase-4 component F